MIDFLLGYLAIGVIVFVVILVAHLFTTSREARIDIEPWVGSPPKTAGRRTWLLENAVIPVLAALLAIIAWPVAIWWKARDMLSGKPKPAPAARMFAVSRDDLLQQTNVREIEERERIVDPMGAVPDVPFGHLNAAWLRFLAEVEPRDQIWTFSAEWKSEWGQRETRAGYVILRSGNIGPHFLSSKRPMSQK